MKKQSLTRAVLALAGTLVGGLLAATSTTTAAQAASCSDVYFYGVAGSGQGVKKGNKKPTYEDRVGTQVYLVSRSFQVAMYRSDSITLASNSYAAVSVADAFFSRDTGKYKKSVESGVAKMKKDLRAQVTRCPRAKIVVAGYSQGAHVSHLAISQMSQSKDKTDQKVMSRVAGVALIADPIRKWRAADIAHMHVDASAHTTIRDGLMYKDPYRSFKNMVNNRLYGLDRYKVVEYCHYKDFVCNRGSVTTISTHSNAYKEPFVVGSVSSHMITRYRGLT